MSAPQRPVPGPPGSGAPQAARLEAVRATLAATDDRPLDAQVEAFAEVQRELAACLDETSGDA